MYFYCQWSLVCIQYSDNYSCKLNVSPATWIISPDEVHREKSPGSMNWSNSIGNILALFKPVLIQSKSTGHRFRGGDTQNVILKKRSVDNVEAQCQSES